MSAPSPPAQAPGRLPVPAVQPTLTRLPTGAPAEDLLDLYENAPCGYLSLHTDGRIYKANATFSHWCGYEPTTLVGRPFQSLLNTAGRIFYETHFAPLLRLQGHFNEVALDLVTCDGQRLPVLVNAVERRDEDGQPVFIRVTVFNATDRRRYERELLAARDAAAAAHAQVLAAHEQLQQTNQQLVRAHQELNAFYDTLPVGVFRSRASTEVEQANRHFLRLLGVPPGQAWLHGVHEDDRTRVAQAWQATLEQTGRFETVFRPAVQGAAGAHALIETPVPTERHVALLAVVLRDADNQVTQVVGVVEDVTQRLAYEQARRDRARQAAIHHLTAGLAQNLNNILTVVLGNAELMLDQLPPGHALHSTAQLSLGATEAAATLVRRLMAYAGHGGLFHGHCDVQAVVQAVVAGLDDRAGHGDAAPPVTVSTRLAAPGAVVDIGSELLQESLQALIANAWAAMPRGGHLRLATFWAPQGDNEEEGQDDVPGPAVVISVEDDGMGMDPATLQQAPEPFFTTRETGHGMGLGLSLVDGVARMLGGRLRLHSAPGAGTRAELHLPARGDRAPATRGHRADRGTG